MEKLTKARIEEMANEIADKLRELGISDTIIYYNNKRMFVDYGGKNKIEENIDPHDYFEYASYNHILSMSFEGQLYDLFYEYCEVPWLSEIFSKYGVYSELGNLWNLTTYPDVEGLEVEYTKYERPKPTTYIYNFPNYDDKRIQYLIYVYNESIRRNPSHLGSCVIGDGIRFKLDGKPYFFSTNWNQSEAPTEVIADCKAYLNIIGATEIYYDCGRLD